MKKVRHNDDVLTLAFNLQRVVGDDLLQYPVMCAITGEEGLVSEQQHTVAQVRVEVSDEVTGLGHRHGVLAEDALERFNKDPFAGAFTALQDDCDLSLFARELNH